MYKTLRKVLLPLILVIALACTAILAVACTNDEETKVTYSVTVTLDSGVEGISLTSLKAQWLSNNTPVGDPVALNAEGKASVELDAGSYTVDLVGVPATAQYTKATVTAISPNATIKISKKVSEDPVAQPLPAPTDVTVVGDMLAWSKVNDASGYAVYDGATLVEGNIASNVTSYNLATADLSVGMHAISVVAKGDGTNHLDSEKSATVNYEVKAKVNPDAEKLGAPTGLKIEDGVLTWTEVEHAVSYNVYKDGAFVVNVTVASYTLPTDLAIGTHSYTVEAVGDGVDYSNSDKSAPCEYEVEDPIKPLATPTELKIEDGVLTWSEVEHAVSYDVYVCTGSFDAEASSQVANVTVASYTLPTNLEVGSYYYTVVAKSNGVDYYDSIMSEFVTYVVRPAVDDSAILPEGGTEHWYNFGMNGSWQHQEGVPYAISAVGKYYIPVKFAGSGNEPNIYADVIKFIAPEEGEHSYTFSWVVNTDIYSLAYMNTMIGYEVDDIEDSVIVNDDDNGTLIFSLAKGEEVIIILQYNDTTGSLQQGDSIRYEFTVEAGEPIVEGSLYMPIELNAYDLEKTHSAPEGYEALEAYFVIPYDWSGNAYTVTFGEGVQVGIMYSISDTPKNLVSGDWFVPNMYFATYIKVSATAGAKIEFTLAKAVLPGSPEKPIKLEKDVETTFEFVTSNDAWFTFTTGSQAQWYRFEAGSTVTIYASRVDDGEGSYYPDYSDFYAELTMGKKDVYLEANHTYYVILSYTLGETTIKVTDTPNEAGSIVNPTELTIGVNSIDVSKSSYVYLKYTVNVDITNTLNVIFNDAQNGIVGVYIDVYSDSGYSVYYVSSHEWSYEADFNISATNGVTIYILLNVDYAKEQGYVKDTFDITLSATLKAPTVTANVTSKKVTWTKVVGATGYIVYNGNEVLANVSAETFEYDMSSFGPGSYSISVQAKGDGQYLTESSKASKTYLYEVQLAAPTNVAKDEKLGTVTWDAVDKATSYRIYVDTDGGNSYFTTSTNSWEVPSNLAQLSAGLHTFYITALGPTGYTESESVSIEYTVKLPTDFEVGAEKPYEVSHLGRYIIYLESGTYTIILTGDYKDHFIARDTGDGNDGITLTSSQASQRGDLIVPGLTSTAVSFKVTKASYYQLVFIDNEALLGNETEAHTCYVEFVTGSDRELEAPGLYNITLDEEKEIKTPGSYQTVDYTFVSEAPGWYEIVISGVKGEDYNVRIDNAGDPLFTGDFGATSGIFQATSVNQEIKVTFYTGSDAQTFTALITYHHPADMELEVVDENATNAVTSGYLVASTGTIGAEDEEALSHVGKLILSGLTPGQKYTIIVEVAMNKSSDFKLVYDGTLYKSYTSTIRDNYCISFEATTATTAYFYSISVESSSVTMYSLRLVAYVEGDEPLGPGVGDKTQMTPGDSKANAVVLDFGMNFIAGEEYVLSISDGDGWYMWKYHLVLSDGTEIHFAYPSGDTSHYEASFTAIGGDVKIYGDDHPRGSAPSWIIVEVLVAPNAAVGGGGDEGGDDEIDGVAVWNEEVTLESSSWYFKVYSDVHFDAGTYKIQLTGAQSDITFKYRLSGGDYGEETTLTDGSIATFVIDADGNYDIWFSTIDSVAQTFTATVYAPAPAAYWEQEYQLGGSTNMLDYTVHFEAGTYTITMSGDIDAVKINDGGKDVLGNGGDLLANGETTATFTVAEAGDYTIRVINMLFDGSIKTINVVINVA